MKTGIQKVSIYDPSDGTVVQFNNVSTEAEFNKAGMEQENSKGQMLYTGDESMFEFLAFDQSVNAQLEQWMEDETDLNMVVLGVDENILWYEPSKITVRKNYLSPVANRNGSRVKIFKKGGSHNILTGLNLLHIINGWADGNANNLADNYTKAGTYTSAFGSEQQTINALASAAGLGFTAPQLIFPISNAKLQFSVDPVTVTNGTGLSIVATLLDYEGNTLAGESAAIATGLKEFTTPSNFYKASLNCLSGTVGGSNLTYIFKYPYFGVQRGEHKNLAY